MPRSKSEKLWMIPISPCDPNVMLFRHLDCAIQTELVVKPDIPLIEMVLVGWHYAKVKGRVELTM